MTETPKNERTAARRMAFTDLGLARLKHPASGQTVVWDTKQPGLSVLISGAVKSYRATFQLDGRYATSKIGRYGEMTLGDARATTAAYRVAAGKGEDPRRPKASALTYENVVDQFIELYAKPRQRTWDQTERVLKRSCADWLKRPIDSIHEGDAYKLLDAFVRDGHVYKAAVTLRWLRTFWKWAWKWAWKRKLVASPFMEQVDIEYERRERNRVYTDTEVKAIWEAATKLEPIEAGYIKLLLLLVPRKTALAAMKRSHFDDADNPTLWTVQGNESRLTSQWPQNLQQVLRIPRGALAASLDGPFVGDLADQIEGEVADHGHVAGSVAGAQS